MEIATAPHYPAATPWWRWVLLAVVLGPVTVLVLLPLGLGLHRFVLTGDSMAPDLGRGSMAFERVVPVSDLRVGDVITYAPPAGEGEGQVTRRVVSLGPEGIVTRADAEPQPDPWVLRPGGPTISKVEYAVPWIGWSYLALSGVRGWLVLGAATLGLVVLAGRRARPPLRSPAPGPD